MKRSWWAIVAALAVVAPMASPAQAKNLIWIEQAYDRLHLEVYANSERPLIDWFAQRVDQGQARTITVVPQELGHFTFIGACDHDCSQFSVTIFDYRGQTVQRQLGSDGHASASAYLTPGQTYTVQFFPEDCTAAFCYTIAMALN